MKRKQAEMLARKALLALYDNEKASYPDQKLVEAIEYALQSNLLSEQDVLETMKGGES